MDQHDLKVEMLGALKPRTVTGAFQPSRNELMHPLEPGAVAHGFCRGCGLVFAITAQGRDVFRQDFGISIPDDASEIYIHFSRCVYCDTQFHDPEARQIPQ